MMDLSVTENFEKFSCNDFLPLELDRKPDVLDLHPLHMDSPGVSGQLQAVVHRLRDVLPVREDLRQVPGAEDVPEENPVVFNIMRTTSGT